MLNSKKGGEWSKANDYVNFICGLNDGINILFKLNSIVFYAIKPMT